MRSTETGPNRPDWTSARELVGDVPRTDDDVPLTLTGERLDTPAKLRAFLEELNAGRTESVDGEFRSDEKR
jgi:hypothetical protein